MLDGLDIVATIRDEFTLTDLWRALWEYAACYHRLPDYILTNPGENQNLGPVVFQHFRIYALPAADVLAGTVRIPGPEPKPVKEPKKTRRTKM